MQQEEIVEGNRVSEQQVHDNYETGIIRYAWGNQRLKTWFITKSQKTVVPEGCRLLFTLTCEYTTAPISIADTWPQIGDVLVDVDGARIGVKEVNWI